MPHILDPTDTFDARANFSKEDRLAPFARGQRMPDWKTAFKVEWRGLPIPFTVVAGYALVVINRDKKREFLEGERSILRFPDADCFPRVDLRTYRETIVEKDGHPTRRIGPILDGADFVARLADNLIHDLRRGSLIAFGRRVLPDGKIDPGETQILPGEWRVMGFNFQDRDFGDNLTAYRLMDDETHREETLAAVSSSKWADRNLPIFRVITFDANSVVDLIEGQLLKQSNAPSAPTMSHKPAVETPEPPEGYLPLGEAWPRWLNQRYPKSSRKILDPETYRPHSLVTRTYQSACDVLTGRPVMAYASPDERALAYNQSILFADRAAIEKDIIEGAFWEFCIPSGVWAPETYPLWTKYFLQNPAKPTLLHFKNGSWHRVTKGQWEVLRSHLWQEIVFEDLQRTDHGPPRWKARAPGEIPSGYAVDRAALEMLLSYGPASSELDAEEQRSDAPNALFSTATLVGTTAEKATEVSLPSAKRTNLFSEAGARATYLRRVSDWPDNMPPPPRTDDEKQMKSLHPGISREFVRKLRNELAPISWRSPGRRSSR